MSFAKTVDVKNSSSSRSAGGTHFPAGIGSTANEQVDTFYIRQIRENLGYHRFTEEAGSARNQDSFVTKKLGDRVQFNLRLYETS